MEDHSTQENQILSTVQGVQASMWDAITEETDDESEEEAVEDTDEETDE